ncbi:DUF3011 domain-containing protein [Pseudoxanthomonas putridarboris]|uniref:DUF3011 domain-containing protein n=1 Tax=Pseudoxanthomonas putridarboris TaxID=752605 RepID=A0ABU9J414_9GAMM
MKKPFLQSVFVLLLAFMAAPPAFAQVQTRAYAPENLRTLSVSDQTRVISQEYSEQSRGRRIPDDQLRFYLDQVNRSNWTFSRIKQDIAQSLAGSAGPRPPTPGSGGQVTCESKDNRRRECPTGFRGRAVLVQNLSGTRCVEGQNWGSRAGAVWVDRGCRGRFAEQSGSGGIGGVVKCESANGAYRECRTGFRGRAVVQRQLSSTRCNENQNWGQRQGLIWVRGGCRAEFRDSGTGLGGGNDYSVTCSSQDNRRKTCAYDARQGRPILLQQLSNQSCREGYSWGYAGSQVWVDRGCRGRFGPR